MTHEQAIQKLQEASQRITPARKAILQQLEKHGAPVAAPDILKLLAKAHLDVNKTTIYRELEFLVAQGLVSEVHLGSDSVHYEIAGDHHHHFVCVSCKDVQELDIQDEGLEKIERKIEKQTKVKVTSHMLEFFGLCAVCK